MTFVDGRGKGMRSSKSVKGRIDRVDCSLPATGDNPLAFPEKGSKVNGTVKLTPEVLLLPNLCHLLPSWPSL